LTVGHFVCRFNPDHAFAESMMLQQALQFDFRFARADDKNRIGIADKRK
jgi:hypothetical protein